MTTIPRKVLTPLFAFLTFVLAAMVSMPTTCLAQQAADNDRQLVRISRNKDGSTTAFKRNPNNTVLRKETYIEKKNGEKIVRSVTIYKRDKFGNLRNGSIYDGQMKKLFRIVYGYHRVTGRLIAEDMFDAQVKRTDPTNPVREEPVRATRYHYNAQGKRSAPVVFTSPAGKTSEELMSWLKENKPGSDYDADPFRNTPVNPNSRPVGR